MTIVSRGVVYGSCLRCLEGHRQRENHENGNDRETRCFHACIHRSLADPTTRDQLGCRPEWTEANEHVDAPPAILSNNSQTNPENGAERGGASH